MDNRKHIALVTTWFEPLGSVATNRMNALAKYLDRERYRLTVVTRNDGTLPSEGEVFGVRVHRLSPSKLFRRRRQTQKDGAFKHKLKSVNNVLVSYLFEGDFPGWAKKATSKLESIHTESPFDAVITSFGPLDPCIAGYDFIKKYNDVKWLADMRDEMSTNPYNSVRQRKKLLEVERKIAKEINAITTVSEPILRDFEKQFPEVKLFEEVRNGFDHDLDIESSANNEFTVVYAGTFYGKNKPQYFFQALQNLRNSGVLDTKIRLKFVGTTPNFTIPIEFKDEVEFIPRVPVEEAVKIMIGADCNLLLEVPLGTMGRFTGKVFDYLSVEKPILALVDVNDVAADLIREHNCGEVVDFFSVEEIEKGLMQIYTDWKTGTKPEIDREKTKSLHRKFQVKKLEDLLTKLVEE